MDEVTEKLTKIFQIVNDWLKFAEAKNAVLLGFSGAGMAATLAYLSAASNIPKSIYIGFLTTTSFLCLCSLVCSLSFLPKTNLEYIVWKKSKPQVNYKFRISDNDNFYYFGHLFKYKTSELIDAINRLYFEGQISNVQKKEYFDLSNQIIVNSEITYLKFKLFSFALYILIGAIISIPICLVLSLIIYHSI
ncbi:hypothetical protein [Nostoc sp. UHCC 0251]|uniref:hypothetical protein n=1 Tax=Nostoc sp. UHCC 0251 TaxID=3110240 RepID=UPI002B212C33|nr:hypothetical protein [Nostoc sp. UHCC 0251]MEA5622794.1 hypothetical protein [Nostoc sp. UHCC 0251]